MRFEAIPAGTALFVDANPIVYAVTSDPKYGPACQMLTDFDGIPGVIRCTPA